MVTDKILSNHLQKVNPENSASPSLVNNGQSGTWNRRQRRTFQRIRSWSLYLKSRGYQLLRIDLTSGSGRKGESLTEDFKKLRRQIERKFINYKLHFFRVQTFEGNGVLHLVVAVKWDKPIYISQVWLSETWEKLHGAHRVWIKRMDSKDGDLKRVSRYFCSQYLAGQSSITRVSWSWWRDGLAIGKAWDFYRKQLRKFSEIYSWVGLNVSGEVVTFKRMIEGWNKILIEGWAIVGRMIFFTSGRGLDCAENNVEEMGQVKKWKKEIEKIFPCQVQLGMEFAK